MRAVILLIAVATAAAELPSGTEPVPAVLGDATPADVLKYLYDVVLQTYMIWEANEQGGHFDTIACVGNTPLLKNEDACAVTTTPVNPSIIKQFFDRDDK